MNAMGTPAQNALSLALVTLMKDVMDRDHDAARWQSLLDLQTGIRDHVAVLGLELILDEAEGTPICANGRYARERRNCHVWFPGGSWATKSVSCSRYCARNWLSSTRRVGRLALSSAATISSR